MITSTKNDEIHYTDIASFALCKALGYADNLVTQAVVRSVIGSLGRTDLLDKIDFRSTKSMFKISCADIATKRSVQEIIVNMVEQAQKRINKPVVYETSA